MPFWYMSTCARPSTTRSLGISRWQNLKLLCTHTSTSIEIPLQFPAASTWLLYGFRRCIWVDLSWVLRELIETHLSQNFHQKNWKGKYEGNATKLYDCTLPSSAVECNDSITCCSTLTWNLLDKRSVPYRIRNGVEAWTSFIQKDLENQIWCQHIVRLIESKLDSILQEDLGRWWTITPMRSTYLPIGGICV